MGSAAGTFTVQPYRTFYLCIESVITQQCCERSSYKATAQNSSKQNIPLVGVGTGVMGLALSALYCIG